MKLDLLANVTVIDDVIRFVSQKSRENLEFNNNNEVEKEESNEFRSARKVSGYGKPLLSYHVQGAKDSKGLADLGLVEVEKGNRGKISAKLTTLDKLLVTSNALSAVQ
jgi:hypothetical protein